MDTSKQGLSALVRDQGAALGLNGASSDIIIQNMNAGTLPMCVGSPFTDDEQETDDFRIIKLLFDNSSSMDPVESEVIASVNDVAIPGLLGGAADQVGAIRVGGLTFNHMVRPLWQSGGESGFYPLSDLPKLTSADYRTSGSTALHQGILDGVTALTAYALQVRARTGSNPECVLAVWSDGANNQRPLDPDVVRQVLTSLSPELFTLVFIGFETGERVDFVQIATELGFRDILHSKAQPGESADDQRRRFRNVMRVFSDKLVKRVSTSQVGLKAPSGGNSGFWTP
ncbi:MAG: VWA domain-containing protein [bacterium]|nr:VWA domain-containing protein [bacterium]